MCRTATRANEWSHEDLPRKLACRVFKIRTRAVLGPSQYASNKAACFVKSVSGTALAAGFAAPAASAVPLTNRTFNRAEVLLYPVVIFFEGFFWRRTLVATSLFFDRTIDLIE